MLRRVKVEGSRVHELATKRDLMELEVRIIKWMIALLAGQGALIVTLLKLFPAH